MKLVTHYAGALRTMAAVNSSYLVASTIHNTLKLPQGQPIFAFNSLSPNATLMHDWMYPDYVVKATIAETAAIIDTMLANPPCDAIVQ